MTDYVLGFDADYTMPAPAREALASSAQFLDVYALKTEAVMKGDLAFSVRDFGAVADGVTDDAAAIQNAVDAAAIAGGVVVFPPGDYGVGSIVRLPANAQLFGYGATLHRLNADIFQNWASGDTTTGVYDGPSHIGLFGLTIDSHGDTNTNDSNVVTFSHCADVVVMDCRFLRTRGFHALELNSVNGAHVSRCSFLGYNAGAQTGKEALQIDYASSTTNSGLADDTVTKNVWVRDCIFDGYGAMGVQGIGIGAHVHAPSALFHGIHISGCEFRGVNRAVVAYWFEASSVTDCVIVTASGQQGVRLEGCSGVVVRDVHVSGTPGTGITLATGTNDNVTVDACTVISATTQGIYVGGSAANAIVRGNRVYRSAGNGIVVDGTAASTLVSGNLIVGAGYTAGANGAIRVTGTAANTSITGNRAVTHGAGTEVTAGVSVGGSATGTWAFGNDFLGLSAATSGTVNTTGNRT